ncbi:MAG: hypothetical protein ACXACC_09550, partial [Promethearchaeota archaeon]
DNSNCGAIIFKDKIPINEDVRNIAAILHEDEYNYALFGGEDFELLYTVSRDNLDKIDGFLIGEIIKNRDVKLVSNEEENVIYDLGYDHFSKNVI